LSQEKPVAVPIQ